MRPGSREVPVVRKEELRCNLASMDYLRELHKMFFFNSKNCLSHTLKEGKSDTYIQVYEAKS